LTDRAAVRSHSTMSITWPSGSTWTSLADAIRPGVQSGLSALGLPEPTLTVQVGPPGGPLAGWSGDVLILHGSLAGPTMHAKGDAPDGGGPPELAMDRWRRATGLVLEAAILTAAAEERSVPVAELAESWHAQAAAADAVDRVSPALGWLWGPLAGLLAHPSASALDHPRRLAWWLRAHPDADDSLPEAASWASFGKWLRDRHWGPLASCPLPLPMAAPARPSNEPGPARALSHHILELQGGTNGTRWSASHGAIAGTSTIPADQTIVAVLGVTEAAVVGVAPAASPPVGTWALTSGHFGAHVGAARGVELTLSANGRAELTGADAFVGPPTRELLAMADKYGVSGSATGRWRLTACNETSDAGALTLMGLDGDATVHPRSGHGFAFPAGQWLDPVRGVLKTLDGRAIRWTRDGPAMTLRVDLNGTDLAFEFTAV
jgi:hypothetical protein